MTEANSNTSSLTKQRQKQWQKLMVIPLVLQNKDKNKQQWPLVLQNKDKNNDSNTSSLTKQRQKW